MVIRINNIKLNLLILLLSLFFVSSIHAATYYVDPNGLDSNNGGIGKPWKTVKKALASVDYGDTVSINDGTYSEGQLVVPEGVNLTSTSQNRTNVKLQPNTNMSASVPFILLSSNAGSDGNQRISYLELDGINGNIKAYTGIAVKSRNNVRIDHCNIHDFYGTWKASAVWVESLQTAPTNQWWNLWPADPQEPGNDSNINALWPSNPVTNFELDNNIITEGGYRDPDGTSNQGAVQLWNLKDSKIHHNTITTTVISKGQCIAGAGGKTALLDNVDIYYNTLNNYLQDKANFSLETWVHKGGCDIFRNTSTGWFSITVGKETAVYDNYLSVYPPETEKGIGIEFNQQSYSSVKNNYIENAKWGIIVGFSESNSVNWITKNVTVRDNVLYNSAKSNIWVECLGARLDSTLHARVENINVKNNKIIGEDPRGTYGISVTETKIEGSCSLSNVAIRDNIITGYPSYAGRTNGTVDNLTIEGNNFYGNGIDRWIGATDIDTDTSDAGLPIPPLPPDVLSNQDSLTPPILSILSAEG